jgi:ribonuclease BN (tRNA processing enzyme)
MSEWRVYGCGSVSSGRSLQSSYEWIEGGFRLQVDFGNGALYRRCIAQNGIAQALDSINHIFLSHGHPDHIIELSRLVVALKHSHDYISKEPVYIYGTEQTIADVMQLMQSIGKEEVFNQFFSVCLVKPCDQFEIDDHIIQIIPAQHLDGSVGLRIQSPSGLQIGYTGDTGRFDQQEETLSDLDLLVAETSCLSKKNDMHMNLEQAAQLAGSVSPRALMLVHFNAELEALPQDDIQKIITKWYDGEILVAVDGMALNWNRESWNMQNMF